MPEILDRRRASSELEEARVHRRQDVGRVKGSVPYPPWPSMIHGQAPGFAIDDYDKITVTEHL